MRSESDKTKAFVETKLKHMRGLNFFVRAMIMEMDLPPHANHTYHTDRQVGACVRISWPIISPKLHQKVDLFIR